MPYKWNSCFREYVASNPFFAPSLCVINFKFRMFSAFRFPSKLFFCSFMSSNGSRAAVWECDPRFVFVKLTFRPHHWSLGNLASLCDKIKFVKISALFSIRTQDWLQFGMWGKILKFNFWILSYKNLTNFLNLNEYFEISVNIKFYFLYVIWNKIDETF